MQLAVIALPEWDPAIEDVLQELSERGFLDPVLLVTTTGTYRLEGGNLTEVDLWHHLAAHQLDGVQLVSLGLVDSSGCWAHEAIPVIEDELRTRCRAAGVDFQAASAVIPADGVEVPAEAFFADWEVNVLHVPEHTAGSSHMIALGLEPKLLPPLAASLAASLTGSWSWIAESPLVNEEIQFVQGQRTAYLGRLTVRLVDANELAEQIMDWAMSREGIWPVPDGCVAHPDPGTEITRLARTIDLTDALGFNYRPAKPRPDTEPAKVRLRDAFTQFYRGLPRNLVGRRFDEGSTPSECWAEVESRPDELDLIMSGEAHLARLHRREDVQTAVPTPSPTAWATMRSVLLGLVDGGDFAGRMAGSELTWSGKRAVVEDRSHIVPDPTSTSGDGFQPTHEETAVLARQLGVVVSPSELTLRGSDAVAAARLDDAIDRARTAAEAARKSEADKKEGKRDGELLGRLGQRLTEWRSGRSDNLAWKLGLQIDKGLETAQQALATADDDLATLPKREKAARHEQQRVARLTAWFTRTWLAVTAIAAVWSTLTVSGIWPGPTGAPLVMTVVLTALGGLVSYPLARERAKVEADLADLMVAPSRISLRRQHAANEFTRLTAANDQFCDWAAGLGALIHDPWGSPEEHQEPAFLFGSEYPLNVTTSTPSPTDDEVAGQIVRLRRLICSPGWLNRTYGSATDAWQHRYRQLSGDRSITASTPDNDARMGSSPLATTPGGETIYGARTQLSRELVEGRHHKRLRRRQRELMTSHLDSRRVDDQFSRVHTHVAALDGASVADFLGSLDDEDPADFAGHVRNGLPPIDPAVRRRILAVPTTALIKPVSSGAGHVQTDAVPDRTVLGAFRLDLSDRLPVDDLGAVR